jgi:hypothetical protein
MARSQASGRRWPVAGALLVCLVLAGCHSLAPAPPQEPEPLPVKKVLEEIIVAAWAEPSHLPRGGGQAQILIRVQKRGGGRYPGVEVRLAAAGGALYSGGRVLVTDTSGMTRDRLTAQKSAMITLNAGGTKYTFKVPVGDETAQR